MVVQLRRDRSLYEHGNPHGNNSDPGTAPRQSKLSGN